MQQQPSAQGIASIYRGNPQPLQQRIQTDQKANPGLPPDLQKMLALQIVTNEKDGFAAQKAMQQLQQMSGGAPGGQPPTVMQTLEAQARQKAMTQAPEMDAPQDEAPMGIAGSDRVAFEGAEGGIVAFKEGGEGKEEESSGLGKYAAVPALAAAVGVPTYVYRQAADLAARLGTTVGAVLKSAGKDVAVAGARGIGNVAKTAATSPAGAVLAGGVPATQFAGDVVRAASPEQREGFYDNPMIGAMGGDTALASAIMNQPAKSSATTQKARDATAATNRSATNRSEADSRSAPAVPNADEGIAKDLADLVKRKAQAQTRPAKPAAGAAAAPAPVDPREAAYQKALDDMSLDRDKRAAEAQARMQAQLGGPDTAQYDKAYAEMEKRKGEFNAPKAGFDGLMEYLGQVAQTGRGKKWYEAGAEGGARVEALNKERKTQQFELAKQQVELMQKKMDAERGYKKDLFQMGEAERAAVDKQIDAAVKQYGLDRNEAARLRNQIEQEHIRGKYQLQQARIMADSRTAGATTLTPNQRAMIADKAKDNVANDLKTNPALAMKVGKTPAALAQMVTAETERLMAVAEGRTMAAAPGAPSPGGISLKYNPATGKIE